MSKFFSDKEWKLLKNKFEYLNSKSWEYLDGLQKVSLIKSVPINFKTYPIFGKFNNIHYPKLFQKVILENTFIFKKLIGTKEIGGIIYYPNNLTKIKILFFGDESRINLNINPNNFDYPFSLFHTHTNDDMLYNPPSVLDIVSFILLYTKHISDLIINSKKLVIKNSLVFTPNEIYVYYISQELLENIFGYLFYLKKKSADIKTFVTQVEYLLQKIELYYSDLLYPFRGQLDNNLIISYIRYLNSLGIIMKRTDYSLALSI